MLSYLFGQPSLISSQRHLRSLLRHSAPPAVAKGTLGARCLPKQTSAFAYFTTGLSALYGIGIPIPSLLVARCLLKQTSRLRWVKGFHAL